MTPVIWHRNAKGNANFEEKMSYDQQQPQEVEIAAFYTP